MKKKLRKILTIVIGCLVVMAFIFSSIGATGCGSRRGREFEVDGWTLWQYTRNREVHIIALHDESKVIDGVLTIPTRIGGYNITSFGAIYGVWVTGCAAKKVVVPTEIKVNHGFWMMQGGPEGERIYSHMPPLTNVKYVEFLCSSFENVVTLSSWAVSSLISNDGSIIYLSDAGTVIIPNGSSQKFINKLESLNLTPE